jgi:tRNA-modifying protein YgfZ
MSSVTSPAVVRRPRAFVRVAGPDAEDYLQRMVSNDVAALSEGEACDALLLTARARVIAPLRVLRRADHDFLLLTEPELGEVVTTQLLKTRFAAKVEIEPEEHEAWLVLGGDEVLDKRPAGAAVDEDEFERWRIEAGIPRWGREIDERVLPAEAGLDKTHISFTKGCYPGQEPIARQHYRGKVNRRLRVLELEGDAIPHKDAQIVHVGKSVGRVTSAVQGLALGYVRTDVPDDADLLVGSQHAKVRPA